MSRQSCVRSFLFQSFFKQQKVLIYPTFSNLTFTFTLNECSSNSITRQVATLKTLLLALTKVKHYFDRWFKLRRNSPSRKRKYYFSWTKSRLPRICKNGSISLIVYTFTPRLVECHNEFAALLKKSGTRHEFGKIWPNLAPTCHMHKSYFYEKKQIGNKVFKRKGMNVLWKLKNFFFKSKYLIDL